MSTGWVIVEVIAALARMKLYIFKDLLSRGLSNNILVAVNENTTNYLTISHRIKARWLQAYIHRAAKQRSEYSLVITEPEVTNCLININSVLKNNNIYQCCKYNILHSSAFMSNESSCLQKLVTWFCHFPVSNCQINCFIRI